MLTALTGMVHLLFPEMMMIMRSQYLILNLLYQMVYCTTCRKMFILLTKVLTMALTCTYQLCNLLVVDCK